jgi:DNA-binding transcriptional ArsR family regulator
MSPYNDTFKALADPNRREIIRLLKEKSMTAGEIADKFNISKPSISHHLSILKQADLVDDERKGQNIVYSLNTSVFEEIMRMLIDLFGHDKKTKSEN